MWGDFFVECSLFLSQKAETEAKYGIRKLKTNMRNAVNTHFCAYLCE